jgi:hypothetical protein
MKWSLPFALVLSLGAGSALAAPLVLSGPRGPTVATSPYTGVINKGTITGGGGTGLTVTGTATKTIVNKGTITGSTGVSVSGATGSVTIINRGTIVGTGNGITITGKP